MNLVLLQTVWGVDRSGRSGGGTDHFAELTRLWRTMGHRVTFVTNAYDQALGAFEADRTVTLPSFGTIGSHYPLGTILEYLCNLPIQFRSLARLRGEVGSDSVQTLVISVSSFPSDVASAAYLSHSLKCRGAVYFHHLVPPPWWFGSRRGLFIRTLGNWCAQLFALTVVKIFGLVPTLDQPGSAKQLNWRIRGGFVQDREFLTSLPDRQPPSQVRDLEAVYIGGLVERKGVLDLIPIWARVVRAYPGARLVIGGRAERQELVTRLTRLIRECQLQERVCIKGYLTANEKTDLLSRAKIFVYPSYEEGWSRAVMEAAYFGCVPITWDLPAYDYLGPRAPQARVGQSAQLASLLIEFIENESLRQEVASDLRQRVLSLSPMEIAHEQIEAILAHPYAKGEG